MVKAMNRAVITRPPWVTSCAIHDPSWLPPYVVGAAWAVDVVRALLANIDLEAWADFCVLVGAAKPCLVAYQRRAQANPTWAQGIWNGRRRIQKRALKTAEMPHSFQEFDDAIIDKAQEFATRWLRGSTFGKWVVLELATFVALDADPVEIDRKRAAESQTWEVAYG